MRYSDIPKFTKSANYHVDVGLDYLVDWLEGKKVYNIKLNPDFQRGHVWTEEQQVAYMEYLLRGGKSGREIYFNDSGWNSYEDMDSHDLVCVDGLQRITAGLKFINNELRVFGVLEKEFEDRLGVADVSLSVWINDLPLKKDVLRWYLEMNRGGTPHTYEELLKVEKLLDAEDN